jgi:hypothetical protein
MTGECRSFIKTVSVSEESGGYEVNHGVVAYEPNETRVGSGLWAYSQASGSSAVIFAPRYLERKDYGDWKVVARMWRSSFNRSLGPVELRSCGGSDEYGRFEPASDDSFCRMCRSCVWGPQSWALVLPNSAADPVAVAILNPL